MGGKLPPYAVAESDGLPIIYQPWKIIFPNGTITDVGDGTVFVGIGTSIQSTTSITVGTLDARTPVLLAGTILYFLTDGSVTNFLAGDGVMRAPIEARSPLLKNASIMSIVTDSTYILAASPLLKTGTIFSIQTDATYLLAASPLLKYGTMFTLVTDGTVTNFLSGDGLMRAPIEARSPLLKGGSVMSVLTDGTTTNYLRGDGTYRSVFEARSPLLTAGTVLSILTDGNTANFLRGDGTYAAPPAGSGETISANSPILKIGSYIALNTDGLSTTYLRGDGTFRSVYECRSPLLSAGTVISLNTNGTATSFLAGNGVFLTPVEARSPLLKLGSVMSVQTDNTTTNFFRGDGTYAVPSSNSGIKMCVFTIGSDDSWDSEAIPIFEAPYDTTVTLKQLNATVIGAGTLSFNIEQRPYGLLASAGTNIFASTRSATQTGYEVTTFSSSVVGAKNHLVFTTPASAVAGQVDFITGVIYYKRDSI